MENQVTLVGNMGKYLNVFDTKRGWKIAKFDMVTTNFVKGKPDFEWHRLFCFGNLAQFIEDFGEKGKKIAITGKIVNRTFINKVGQAQRVKEIEVRHVVGL